MTDHVEKKRTSRYCSAHLSSCYLTASNDALLEDPHTFHCIDYFVIGGIRLCLGVFDNLMFLWFSSNSRPLNLLLVRSHQAEIIIEKRFIPARNSVTSVRVEPTLFDQGRRKNDAFTYSATLPAVKCSNLDFSKINRDGHFIKFACNVYKILNNRISGVA